MQVPAARAVTVLPVTLQTVGVVVLKLTARAEVAVALTVPAPPTTIVGEVPKVMVWLPLPMVMGSVACAAAL